MLGFRASGSTMRSSEPLNSWTAQLLEARRRNNAAERERVSFSFVRSRAW